MKKIISLIGLVMAGVMITGRLASAAPAASIPIKNGGDKLKKTLEQLPYAKEGSGPVLYVFEFSDCPYCQQLYKDYNGTIPGVEARYIFYPVNQRSVNETAALALSRNIKDYHAFMKKQKTAPAGDSTDESIDAYNAVQSAVTGSIIPTLQKNGWRSQSLVSPTFIWEENGQLYADGGYKKDYFTTILASVTSKGNTQTAAADKTKPAAAASTTNQTAAPANNAPVPKLTWRDLIGRPERWPEQTTLLVSITVDGEPLNAGLKMKVYDVTAAEVVLLAPKGYTLTFAANETTLLADANTNWATLTPEQRALTFAIIAQDRSLWPSKVNILEAVSFGRLAFKEGSEVDLVEVRANNKVGVYDPRSSELLLMDAKYTDVFNRASKLAAIPVDERPGVVAEILKGLNTVDANGKPVSVKDAKYYVFYMAASTCGFCHAFTPEFVKHYNQYFAGRDDVAFVVWPWEDTLPPMLAYMKKESMPWPTVPAYQKGRMYFLMNGLGMFQTPGLLVVDKFGKPLVMSSKMPGHPTQKASAVVNQFDSVFK
ncbi:MAG: hypothetical protein AB7S78_01530 [Candidatus Omnitrophota bacterium]